MVGHLLDFERLLRRLLRLKPNQSEPGDRQTDPAQTNQRGLFDGHVQNSISPLTDFKRALFQPFSFTSPPARRARHARRLESQAERRCTVSKKHTETPPANPLRIPDAAQSDHSTDHRRFEREHLTRTAREDEVAPRAVPASTAARRTRSGSRRRLQSGRHLPPNLTRPRWPAFPRFENLDHNRDKQHTVGAVQ